jgi:hypothetical protein
VSRKQSALGPALNHWRRPECWPRQAPTTDRPAAAVTQPACRRRTPPAETGQFRAPLDRSGAPLANAAPHAGGQALALIFINSINFGPSLSARRPCRRPTIHPFRSGRRPAGPERRSRPNIGRPRDHHNQQRPGWLRCSPGGRLQKSRPLDDRPRQDIKRPARKVSTGRPVCACAPSDGRPDSRSGAQPYLHAHAPADGPNQPAPVRHQATGRRAAWNADRRRSESRRRGGAPPAGCDALTKLVFDYKRQPGAAQPGA